MKMVKSLLLGSAAGLAAMTGAQAADLPVKAKPVEYVKICSLYGAGFYYIPGTDTCIRIGGHIRVGSVDSTRRGTAFPVWATAGDGNNTRTRDRDFFFTRSRVVHQHRHAHADELRHAAHVLGGSRSRPTRAPALRRRRARSAIDAAIIQWGGFTIGRAGTSYFDNPWAYAFKWGTRLARQSGYRGWSFRCGLHAPVRQRHLRHAVAGRQQGAQARHL